MSVIPGQLDLDVDDQRLPAHWRAPGAPCRDCGQQTVPARGHSEWYMVTPDVWPIGRLDGFLCIGCLEARLGRRLTPADFSPLPINEPSRGDSPRLHDRKGA